MLPRVVGASKVPLGRVPPVAARSLATDSKKPHQQRNTNPVTRKPKGGGAKEGGKLFSGKGGGSGQGGAPQQRRFFLRKTPEEEGAADGGEVADGKRSFSFLGKKSSGNSFFGFLKVPKEGKATSDQVRRSPFISCALLGPPLTFLLV